MRTPVSDLCCWQNPTLGDNIVCTGPCSAGVKLGAGFLGSRGESPGCGHFYTSSAACGMLGKKRTGLNFAVEGGNLQL